MASRERSALAAMVMSLVALVLAHNLVFLAGYGAAYGEALARTGHGERWSLAVETVVASGSLCLLIAAWQLRRLSARVRALGAVPTGASRMGSFMRRWLRLAVGLSVVTALLFAGQENIEHLQVGAALPGLGIFVSREYPNAIPIIALVAIAVAFVGALFGWRYATLLALIRAARARFPYPPRAERRPIPEVDRRPGALLGPGLAVRAPPIQVITTAAR